MDFRKEENNPGENWREGEREREHQMLWDIKDRQMSREVKTVDLSLQAF